MRACALAAARLRRPGLAERQVELYPASMRSQTLAAVRRLTARWAPAESWRAPDASRVLRPTDFGADPTCTRDSAPAFAALTAQLATYVVGNMSDGIKDLGGASIDLGGGCYSLSSTWAIPQFLANFHVAYGEIRADAANFTAGGTLVQVGDSPCKTASGQGSCNQNAGFHGVTFDGSHVAGNNLVIADTMGAVVDSSSVFLNFVAAGVVLYGGHESMISDTWLAAYPWNSPLKEHNNATGIVIDGNDHYVSDTIVYSAQVGVGVYGSADILNGVHTWNDATGNGGVGIINGASQNRFEGCYLDYTDMILQGGGAQQTYVGSGFYLGGAQVVFATTAPGQRVFGVSLIGNSWFATGSAPYAVNETKGAWAGVTDLVISGTNLPQGVPYTGTVATQTSLSLPQGGNGAWSFNFGAGAPAPLLFPSVPIASASAQLLVPTGIAATGGAVGLNITGQTVTVPLPWSAGQAGVGMRVTVDQSAYTSESVVVQA